MQNEFAKLRQQSGLSPEALALSLGYSARTIRRYETGDARPRRPVVDALRRLVEPPRLLFPAFPNFDFIDLFAGIGGLRHGFDAIGGRCVFTCEWNPLAQLTYRANFHDGDDHVFAGDITKVDAKDIPGHDVLVAGFPCQPFSIAGVSKKNALGRQHGFKCEAQGTLFFDVARIIEHHRPEHSAGEREEPCEPRQGEYLPSHPQHAEGRTGLSGQLEGHQRQVVRPAEPRAYFHRRLPRS